MISFGVLSDVLRLGGRRAYHLEERSGAARARPWSKSMIPHNFGALKADGAPKSNQGSPFEPPWFS